MTTHERHPSPTEESAARPRIISFIWLAIRLPIIFVFPAYLLDSTPGAFWTICFGIAFVVACVATPSQAGRFTKGLVSCLLVFIACIYGSLLLLGYLGKYVPVVDPFQNKAIPYVVAMAGVLWNVWRLEMRRRKECAQTIEHRSSSR